MEEGAVVVVLREGYEGLPGVDSGPLAGHSRESLPALYGTRARIDGGWLFVDPYDRYQPRETPWVAVPVENVVAVYSDDRRKRVTSPPAREFALDITAVASAFGTEWEEWVNVQDERNPLYLPAVSLGTGDRPLVLSQPRLGVSSGATPWVEAVLTDPSAGEEDLRLHLRWDLDKDLTLLRVRVEGRQGGSRFGAASAGRTGDAGSPEALAEELVGRLRTRLDGLDASESMRKSPALIERLIPLVASQVQRTHQSDVP